MSLSFQPGWRLAMNRMCFALLFGLLVVATGQAHFPFIVPESVGTSAKVVFSDDLNADTNVNIEKITNTKLTLRDSAGKESALMWKKEEGFYSLNVPGTGTRIVYGVTDYGVLQKGDTKPFKLLYFPKAIIGTATDKSATVGDKLALEIVAVSTFGKVKFQVLAAGKPVSDAEVTILLPDSGRKAMKTDKDGFTTEFDGSGRYGVIAKLFESKSGDHAGKKYEEIRNYATLVCDCGK
jgi:uncharacterized GH25 family protein